MIPVSTLTPRNLTPKKLKDVNSRRTGENYSADRSSRVMVLDLPGSAWGRELSEDAEDWRAISVLRATLSLSSSSLPSVVKESKGISNSAKRCEIATELNGTQSLESMAERNGFMRIIELHIDWKLFKL